MYEVPKVSVRLVRDGYITSNVERFSGPQEVVEFLRGKLQDLDREYCVAIFLGTKNNIVGFETISIGSLNMSILHPREVFTAAYMAKAASIILGHNHPSGDPTPSPEDIDVTRRLEKAGGILGITVLDHVIIGEGNQYYSFEEGGKLGGPR